MFACLQASSTPETSFKGVGLQEEGAPGGHTFIKNNFFQKGLGPTGIIKGHFQAVTSHCWSVFVLMKPPVPLSL